MFGSLDLNSYPSIYETIYDTSIPAIDSFRHSVFSLVYGRGRCCATPERVQHLHIKINVVIIFLNAIWMKSLTS